MEHLNSAWNSTCLFICSKCFVRNGIQGSADELKSEFKASIKAAGQSEEVRAMTSSCLSACPEGKIAALKVSKQGENSYHQEILTFTLDEKDQVLHTCLTA